MLKTVAVLSLFPHSWSMRNTGRSIKVKISLALNKTPHFLVPTLSRTHCLTPTCWFIQRKGVVFPYYPWVLIRLLQNTLGYIVIIPSNIKLWKKYIHESAAIPISAFHAKRNRCFSFLHSDHLSEPFQLFFRQWVSKLSPNLLYKMDSYIFVILFINYL